MMKSSAYLTVGEAARRCGLKTSTLRFYEERGLIKSERTTGNQRRYHRATLRRISVVKRRLGRRWRNFPIVAHQTSGIGRAYLGSGVFIWIPASSSCSGCGKGSPSASDAAACHLGTARCVIRMTTLPSWVRGRVSCSTILRTPMVERECSRGCFLSFSCRQRNIRVAVSQLVGQLRNRASDVTFRNC